MKIGLNLSLMVLLQLGSCFSLAFIGDQQYPMGPNPQVTPGALCNRPDGFRYQEKIQYCNRLVETELKREVIETYDRQFGYNIEKMDRRKFKIDHFIPLCAGGSNERENLWPQHESVYKVTDPLEALVCEKMALGRLKQVDAVNFIRAGKSDLTMVTVLIRKIKAL